MQKFLEEMQIEFEIHILTYQNQPLSVSGLLEIDT